MYKLIVRQARARSDSADDRHHAITRIRAKQFRAKWNFDAKKTGLPLMQHEEVGDQYIVFVMLPSEEEATIFKLTYL